MQNPNGFASTLALALAFAAFSLQCSASRIKMQLDEPAIVEHEPAVGERPGTNISVQTRIGAIDVQALGPSNGSLVVALSGAVPSEMTSFDGVGAALAAEGFHVLLPNLFSNKKVKPGLGVLAPNHDDVSTVVIDLAGDKKIILLGHSWGGNEASLIAAKNPSLVTHLVLSAPFNKWHIAEVAKKLTMPLLLCWAKDDWLMSYSNTQTWRENIPRDLLKKIVTVETGGHGVHQEYVPEIIAFSKA